MGGLWREGCEGLAVLERLVVVVGTGRSREAAEAEEAVVGEGIVE